MADCCTPGTGFPTGPQLGQIALANPIIWEEICMIQQAILEAASPCKPCGTVPEMCTVVGGNTPMTFVSGITSIEVIDPGQDYFADTPAVFFEPPIDSNPTPAEGTVTTNGGNILQITITNGGSGYQPVPATLNVSSEFGTGALLQPLINGAGKIVNINIVDPGLDYTVDDAIIATRAVAPNPAYVDATFKIISVDVLGKILEVAILNPGSGYQDSIAIPKIVSSFNSTVPYPLGSGFLGSVSIDVAGTITSVSIDNAGAGYSEYLPYLVIDDSGTGAVTKVTLNTSNGIESIEVIKPGNNYTQDATGRVFNPPTAGLPNPPVAEAVVDINVAENTWCSPDSNLYYQVWAGTKTNKAILLQLNAVLSYFRSLGYTIVIQTNPDTGSTIQWKICW